jgi:hypothetical protein
MHVHLRRAGATALLAVGAAVLSSACVKDESSLIVVGCLTVPHDTCEVQASTNSAFNPEGTIDAAVAAEYKCYALFENQLVQRGDPNTLKTETSRIEVYQAEVQVLNDDPNTPTAFAKYTVPVSGHADPAVGTQPGVGATIVTAIDNATLQKLAATALSTNKVQQVVSSIVLHARTSGGQEITSNEFKYPITVSFGSACYVPPGEQCSGGTSKPAAEACLFGQDEKVDCRLLSPKALLCQPQVLDPSLPDPNTATCPSLAPAGSIPCQ